MNSSAARAMPASSRLPSSSARIRRRYASRFATGLRPTRARSPTPSERANGRSRRPVVHALILVTPPPQPPARGPVSLTRWVRSSRRRCLRRFDGAVAVVTGGGQGIGAAVANALAVEGAAVVVAARQTDRIERVAVEIRVAGGKAWAVHCDVTDAASVADLAKAASSHAGPVDILINNAGVAHSAPVAKTRLQDWNRVLAVNATGTFLCTRAFITGMLERKRGAIVNVASVAGLEGARYIAAYAAAKHAVVGFTRSVAAELDGTGVVCNAVCPGYVDTEMTQQSVARVSAKTGKPRTAALAAMLAVSEQERLITPQEVAQAVLALCSLTGKPNGVVERV